MKTMKHCPRSVGGGKIVEELLFFFFFFLLLAPIFTFCSFLALLSSFSLAFFSHPTTRSSHCLNCVLLLV